MNLFSRFPLASYLQAIIDVVRTKMKENATEGEEDGRRERRGE